MESITPYLFFPGTCEEAMNFYAKTFNGEISFVQRFGDANMPVDESYKDKIMHATLMFNGHKIQFSDGAPHRGVTKGDNMHLILNFTDEEEMRDLFSKLSEGGSVHMDLQDTFWGAIFGQLEDKYGIRWMFNYDKSSDS